MKIMNLFKGFVLAAISCITFGYSATAQSSDIQDVTHLVMHRAELMNLASSSPRSSELIDMYTDDFESTRMIYLPDGQVRKVTGDLARLKSIVSNYNDSQATRVVSKVDTIHYINVLGNTAIVIFSGNYSMIETETNTALYDGLVITTMYLRRSPNGWKIADQFTTEVRGNINKYPCAYELYQKDANEMLVSVKVPDGQAFAQQYVDINFSELSPGVTLVKTSQGDEFAWEGNNLRNLREGAATTFTGRANSKPAVCEQMVMYYFGNTCSGVKLEK